MRIGYVPSPQTSGAGAQPMADEPRRQGIRIAQEQIARYVNYPALLARGARSLRPGAPRYRLLKPRDRPDRTGLE